MKNWWNDYVGIPYKLHGRDKDGLDCWGLVRLVYKEQKAIDLPSFSDEYFSSNDVAYNEEVIARHKERWSLSDEYTVGDVALFRINGSESHVGIIIGENKFLHAREGSSVSIEKLDSVQWRRRLVGVYKYTSKVEAYVHAVANPLRTLRLDLVTTPGQTLQEIVDSLQTTHHLDTKSFTNHVLFLDGYPIAKADWSTIRIKEGQHLDYRIVPTGGSAGRLLGTLAIMAVAWYAAPYIAGSALGVSGAAFGSAGYAALGSAVTAGAITAGTAAFAMSVATMGINLVGGLLINALFPIRPPEQGGNAADFKNKNIIQGGSNRENPYGSIPVVLGRLRYTPPVGAKTVVENDGDTSYLRMLTVWGYGPLQITDMKLGNVPLSYYDEIEHQTLYGSSEDDSVDVNKFNSIYGQDITQQSPNLELECKTQYLSQVIVTNNNTFEVTVDQQGKDKVHDLQLNDPIQTLEIFLGEYEYVYEGESVYQYKKLERIADLTVTQIITETKFKCVASSGTYPNGTYDQTGQSVFGSNFNKRAYFTGGNPWSEFTISQEVDRVGVTLNLPQGLYGINQEGNDQQREVMVAVQLRPVGETTWNEGYETVNSNGFALSSAFYNVDSDVDLEPVYQWHYINVTSDAKLVLRSGSITNNKNSNPSGLMLTRLQQAQGVGFDDMTFEYLPVSLSQEETIYKVCVYGNVITDVIDARSGVISSGCASNITPGTGLSASRYFSVASGAIIRISESDPNFDLAKGSFYLKDIIKYGYSKTIAFNVSRAQYEIRVRRINSNTQITDTTSDTCVLSYITGYTNTRPINLPKDSFNSQIKVARSAFKIRSTGQVNGLVEGVTATVQTLGEDYIDGVWVANRPIRNPAALFRHVLKHQGNAKASSILLDDAAINDWYNYCKTNGFNFDKIILEPTSILEVLKDIAAAGRASPTMVDGKWSVVIDRPKTTIAQHFTPHNSWGFEGTRSFPQIPHAFRINFNNAEKAWQPDEMIVYNDGYTSANSTLFETIELPGVTDPKNVYKHARFHLAQLKLRPETYTLNVDIEHLICTRGDRVKVVHDVPMWGVGSARINEIIPAAGGVGTILKINESLPMTAGEVYAVRIRTETNSSFVKTVRPVATTSYAEQFELVNYSGGTFTPYDASLDGLNPDDLLLFGNYNEESIDLIVQSIEPADNMSARLTLVDYSPAIYDSDSEVIPPFDSQITKPASLLDSVITYTPTINTSGIISDHRVMEKTGPSSFIYKMLVPINPLNLTKASSQKITHIQGEIKTATGKVWQGTKSIKLEEKGILFSPVTEDVSYNIRVRYVSSDGKVGPWSNVATHTVVGKKVPPAVVTGLSVTPDRLTGKLILKWNANAEIDFKAYEVRTENANWGTTTNRIFLGSATTCTTNAPDLGETLTFYVRALDFGNLYSTTSASVSYTTVAPNTYTGSVTYSYADTSTTASTVTIDWTDAPVGVFAINEYEITLTRPNGIITVQKIKGSTWTTQANWVGNATVTIKSIDILGNKSSDASTTVTISKLRPNAPSGVTFRVSDSQLFTDWADVVKTSLPVGGYEIRKNNTNWGVSDSDLVWKGLVSNAVLKNIGTGTNSWYINTFDTDNVYGSSGTLISFTVSRPSIVSNLTASFSDTSTTNAVVKFDWVAPATTTFAVKRYIATLTKPGGSSVTASLDSTTWTTAADWNGIATLSITTVDVLDQSSATNATLSVSKNPPNAVTGATYSASGSSMNLKWNSAVKATLPIGGYEIRQNDDGWGSSNGLTWRGSATSTLVAPVVLGSNVYYIRAYDTDGYYSTTSAIVDAIVTAPESVGTITYSYTNMLTGTNATLKWDKPISQFALDYYLITITKPGPIVDTVKSLTNEYSTSIDWAGDATVTVVAYDVLGNSSTTSSVTLPKVSPATPAAPNITFKSKSVVFDWVDTARTSLPITGYEIRTTDTGWGQGGHIWKGSVSTADITNLTVGAKTWYLRAFDSAGQYSEVSRVITFTISAPLASTIGTTSFADTSTTGATVTFNWTGNKGSFDIASYNVTLTKPGGVTVVANIASNTWTTVADWIGNATLQVVAVDTLNQTGSAASTTIGKTAPTAPTTVTTAASINGLVINWNEGVKGSLPIAGYELRPTGTTPGTTGYIWKGTASSVTIPNLVLGSNTWDLWAFDTDLRYSATATAISYTAVKPSNPQTLSGVFNNSLTNSLAEFKWVAPSTSAFGINRYQVSLTTTDPVRTISSTRNTTDWSVPADWLGNATLSVTAIDNLGFSSDAVTFVLAKSVPNQPGAFLAPTIKGTTLSLDWPDTTRTSLPIVGYELRTSDSNWGGTGFLWKGSASNTNVDMVGVSSGSTVTWYLRAYDSDNRYSATSRSYQYTVAAPVNTTSLTYQFVDTSLTTATITLRWLDTSPLFGLKHYEITGTLNVSTTTTAGSNLLTLTSTKGIKVNDTISGNANIPAGRKVSQILNATQLYIDSGTGVTAGTSVSTAYNNISYSNSTTVTQDADWLGDKIYTVRTVDLIGNKSTGIQISATKELPAAASNLKAQVIDNTVLLYWDLPQITSLPIAHVLIKKGLSWNTAEIIGTKSGTFTTITEIQGGLYTYWVAVVDTDGNESVPISLAATVSQPPDYIFNAEWTSDFTGTKSNAIIEANTGYLVMPVDTTESFSGHFTTRTWNTPNDQIAAGFPIYIQPGLTTGYYEEVFDYGTTLGSSQVTVSLSGVNIAGSPEITIQISSSLNGSTYTAFPEGNSAFATNFRYVKVRISVTQLSAGNIYSITGLVVRLDAKQRTDSGSSVLTLGGANVQGSVIPDYYDWVAGMTMPPTGYSLNGTAAENTIITAAGPSGLNESVWACIDSDTAIGADGGYNTVYSDIDSTKGYLFAVFIKTTTNNGITYFGTSNNSTILNLGGTVNANPYFWSGDLPALNTWYLVVGYVYPSGYGTTDGGISGIYNLSGTKLVSGTSFKFNSGTTALIQRCYHFDNATGTGTQVQFMTRPVVIQCDAADATSKISYLLKCAMDYGATVKPNVQYVDITSITTTPNSVTPTTTVVDFFDKPYPTRFNIFNYDSSGNDVAGTISWTVRGY